MDLDLNLPSPSATGHDYNGCHNPHCFQFGVPTIEALEKYVADNGRPRRGLVTTHGNTVSIWCPFCEETRLARSNQAIDEELERLFRIRITPEIRSRGCPNDSCENYDVSPLPPPTAPRAPGDPEPPKPPKRYVRLTKEKPYRWLCKGMNNGKVCNRRFQLSDNPTGSPRDRDAERMAAKCLLNKVPFRGIMDIVERSSGWLYSTIDHLTETCQAFSDYHEEKLFKRSVNPNRTVSIATDRQEHMLNYRGKRKRGVKLWAICSTDTRSQYVLAWHLGYDPIPRHPNGRPLTEDETKALKKWLKEEVKKKSTDRDGFFQDEATDNKETRKAWLPYAQLMTVQDYREIIIKIEAIKTKSAPSRQRAAKKEEFNTAIGAKADNPNDDYGTPVEAVDSNAVSQSEVDEAVSGDDETDLADPEDAYDDAKIPEIGSRIVDAYAMTAHFLYLRKMLDHVRRVNFYLDLDGGMDIACATAFVGRIDGDPRSMPITDICLVKIQKGLSVEEKAIYHAKDTNRVAREILRKRRANLGLSESAVDLTDWALAEEAPEITSLDQWEIYRLTIQIYMDRIQKAKDLKRAEKLQAQQNKKRYTRKRSRVMWVYNPFVRKGQPLREVAFLTDLNGRYENQEIARYCANASLNATDRFFAQLRRKSSGLERPILSASSKGLHYLYTPYEPSMVHKLATLYRTYYNYVACDENRETPAMKMGLTDKPFLIDDLVDYQIGRLPVSTYKNDSYVRAR